MSVVSFLILLAIAALCGALGQAIAGYSLGGCLVSIVVGFVGAILGARMSRALGLPEMLVVQVGGEPFPIVWSILGSAVFALLVGVISRPRHV